MLAKFLCRELAALHRDEPIKRNRTRELRWAMPPYGFSPAVLLRADGY